VAGAARGVTAIKLDPRDRVLGFALCRPDSKRDGITVRTSRGGIQKISASKYPLTNRGGKGYAFMQRGSIEAIVPEEPTPIPPMEEVGEGA
jgi:DNA gyrase subunit A